MSLVSVTVPARDAVGTLGDTLAARALARAPRRAPVHLAADLTGALALVRGSLRERTPVL